MMDALPLFLSPTHLLLIIPSLFHSCLGTKTCYTPIHSAEIDLGLFNNSQQGIKPLSALTVSADLYPPAGS